MLALAFYHAQDSAVRDISKYESLEHRAANEALPPGLTDLDFTKQNITKQVLQLAHFSCKCNLPCFDITPATIASMVHISICPVWTAAMLRADGEVCLQR